MEIMLNAVRWLQTTNTTDGWDSFISTPRVLDPEHPPLKLRIPVACDWCGTFVDEVYPDNTTIQGKKINKVCELCSCALEPDDLDEIINESEIVRLKGVDLYN